MYITLLAPGVWASGLNLTRLEVQLVVGDDSETTKAILTDLLVRIPTAHTLAISDRPFKSSKSTLSIAIGPAALRYAVSQEHDGIVVSAYTSSQVYRGILDNTTPARNPIVTAVYADPSPSIQLKLISMIYKRPSMAATLLSEKTAYYEPIIQQLALKEGRAIAIEYAGSRYSLNSVLNRIADYPVILAIPDNSVYSADSIRNILVTSYRRNQSVIGFSAAMVKAGALATSYSGIADINAQLAEIVSAIDSTGRVPEPVFPTYFRVAINEDVARSLNIVIDDQTKKFSRTPPLSQQ